MKKILIATTALVATASVAAAEVSFGGLGRFGLFYDDSADRETRIEQRFRLTITGSTETDAGVKFEGRIRFQSDDQSDGASTLANRSAAGFAVTAGGFRLDIGSVSDVIDSGDVLNYYGYGVGLTSFVEQVNGFGLPQNGFGTKDDDTTVAPVIKLRYTAGDLTVAASFNDDLNGAESEEWQIGAGYSFGDSAVGAAYGEEDDEAFWAIGADGSFGDFSFAVIVADNDADDNDVRFGVSGEYAISSATKIRFVAADNGADDDSETYGVGIRHSLGGGVTLAGGVGETGGATKADLGVQFNF